MKTVTFIHTSDPAMLEAVSKALSEGYGKEFENTLITSEELPEPEENFLKTQCIQFQVKRDVEAMISADTIIIDTNDWNPYTWFNLGMAYKVAWNKNRKELVTVGQNGIEHIQKYLEEWNDVYKAWVNSTPIEFKFDVNRASNVLDWVKLGYLWGDVNNNYYIVSKLIGDPQPSDYIIKFLSTEISYE